MLTILMKSTCLQWPTKAIIWIWREETLAQMAASSIEGKERTADKNFHSTEIRVSLSVK